MTRHEAILDALAAGPSYGYAIRKHVMQKTGEDLTFGTLYIALDDLLREDYVVIDHEETTAAGNLRRFYTLAFPDGRPPGYHVHVQPGRMVTPQP